jgi:hypothetical protein
MDFKTVFSNENNFQYSESTEGSIEYEEKEEYLIVTSKSRNVTQFPSTSSFSVELDNEFRNIRSITLVQAILPDKGNVTQEPYLLLQINEIDNVMESPDNIIQKSFAFLCTNTATEPGYFITIDRSVHENTPKVYKDLKSSLSRLTLRLVDSTGTTFNFGNPVNPLDKAYQTTFVFKITTVEKKRLINKATF